MKRIHLLFLVFLFASCGSDGQGVLVNAAPDIYEDGLKEGVVLIDVRTPEEFEEDHIANAININFYDADFEKRIAAYNNKKTIYVYCKSGGRSNAAALKMLQMSFSKVVNLEGRITAWKDLKKPVVKD